MSDDTEGRKLGPIGIKLTIIYLMILFGGIPLLFYFGLLEVEAISLNELGDFLAGAFGPLAIFWVVLGFFQQGKELQNSVRSLNFQTDELRRSVEQQKSLVEITQAQLELDQQARNDERDEIIDNRMPHFTCEFGNSNHSNKVTTQDVVFSNVGSDAQTFDAKCIKSGPKGQFVVDEVSRQVVTANSKVDWSVETTGHKLSELKFFVVARNLHAERKTQKFKVSEDGRLHQYESVSSTRARNRNWNPEKSEDDFEL